MRIGALNYDIKVTGLQDVTYMLRALPTRVREKVRKAELTMSRLIVARARSLVPVDTGALKASIHAEWSKTNPLVRQIIATGGAGGRTYAAPVEYGRKKFGRKDAQPFLRPAMASMSLDAFGQTQDAVDSAIRSFGIGSSKSG